MAFNAIFHSDLGDLDVKDIDFSVSQQMHYDSNSPNSKVHPSTISLALSVKKDAMGELWKWAIQDIKEMDGSISIMSNNGESVYTTLEFKKGHCINFTPDYLAGGADNMPVHITIASSVVTFCDEPIEIESENS